MDKKIMTAIAVVVVAVVVIAAAAVFVLGKDKGSDDTEYYFYLYFGEGNADNGWYSADAKDTNSAFEKAMDKADFEFEVSEWGYVQSINKVDNGSGWYCAQYVYADADSAAAEGSIASAEYSWGNLAYSNGWKQIAGYGEGKDLKLSQLGSTIYFLSPYKADWTADGPDIVSGWMTTGPFHDGIDSKTQTYDFYLYFGEGNSSNGWYSADAKNATSAFEKAMDKADFEFEVSEWGYVQSINKVDNGSGWYCAQYLYAETDSAAAEGSIASAEYSWGNLAYSNGWKQIAGYGEGKDLKLSQLGSTIYFLSPYKADWTADGPDVVSGWTTTGPFE